MSSRAIWPKLDDDKAFEKLCRDILREKTGLNWQIYGRKGQRQHGIDIKCSVKQTNRIYVAQCKNYTVSDADRLIKDIAGDVEKIVQQTNVDKIFIMTSHDRDNKVQDFITELRGKYTVDIVEEMFWDTITETFSSNATLMAKYEHYIKGRIGFSSPYAHESQLTSLLLFKNSKTHYQRLREGRFAYLKFDENLFADTKPIDILLKNPNEKTETLLDTLKNHEGNFIFIGEGGTGKTTSLLRIWEEWLKEKKELPLYVPLNEYNIEKQKNFITSYLKRYYDNFDLSTTKDPVILLLDGFNEIYRDPNMAVIEEIKLFVARPKTRIVITSRYNLDTYDALEGFVSYNIEPLSSERIEKFWMSVKTANPNLCNVNLPDNPQKLLATPMMLTLFANTCAIKQKSEEKSGIFQFKPFKTNMGPQTKGELIYNYLLCQLVKLVDSKQQNDLYSTYVALFWVAPYAAWRMESKGLFSEEKRTMRQDMEDYLVKNETFIRSSAGTFLDEAIERYKIRCPDKPLKELLFNTAHPDTPSIIDLLVNVFHLLSTEDIRAEKKRYTFRHQHFRDFLSALHIDNALAIALSETGKFIPEEIKDRILPSYIFDMLGGYYGDYQNQEKCNIRTRLHELLDRLRLDDSQAGFAVNNVIGVWRTSRKDQIVDENLSKLNLTNVPLNNILFSTPNRATCFNESTISDITLLPQGHSGGIKSVTFSADESRILTASYDGTVREWDRETGKCLRIFKGHTNGVESAVYSLDGTRILTASWDKTVREWDRETGQILHTFVDHNSAVSSAVYSVDGKRILSASEDNTVREWDRQTGECIRIFKGHTRYVYSAVYSADEICILSASRDETVREWDRQTGKCIRTFKGHTHGAGSAVYSLDGSQILSTSMDGAVREWDRQTGKCLRIFKGHTSYVHNAVYSADESCILSASRDETVREWDRETGKCLRIFKGHTSFVYSAVYSLDGSRILSASGDGTIREWDRETGECIRIFKGHASGVETAVYSADESCILTASYDGAVREWDRETGECLRAFKSHTSFTNYVVYSADETCILSASGDGTIREWNRKTGECLRIFKGHTRYVYSAVYSLDGSHILTASWDKTVREWDRETGECLRIFKGHVTYVHRAVYSLDGSHILTASWDKTVREWDRETGKCLRIFKGHTSFVYSAVYSLDGSRILSASGDGTIREWDRETGKCLRIFKGHTTYVHSAVYSPDGSRILSTSRDGTIREWDRETGKCLRIFKGHTSFVYSAVYSLDGSRILSASGDGTIREWDRETGECLWGTPPYGGVFIVGCTFKKWQFGNEELKKLIKRYGGKI